MASYRDILLTVDFDRTLTGPDSTIPERNIAAIREFMAKGGAFTVNTGRSLPMFRRLLPRIPVNAPLLLYNGSGAYDGGSGELTQLRPIHRDMFPMLEKIAAFCPDVNVEIQGTDGHYRLGADPEYGKFYDNQRCAWGFLDKNKDYGPFLKVSLFGPVPGYTVAELFRATPEEMARFNEIEAWLNREFGDTCEIFRSGHRVIDIHTKGVSKARAARDLLEKLGRRILVCAGDAENDLTMLGDADFAYCPEDGVVANRFENVCPCGDGAVADVIWRKIPEILKKIP